MAGSAVIIGTGYDADDTSVGPIVGVSDERLEEFQVFAEHSAPSLMVKTLMTVAIRLTVSGEQRPLLLEFPGH
ncbi:hypothetical protein CN138_32290 [Sinorhizobium meliloti]|nr:hypothetical protein CN164_32205 [Sinorhizobium meliloti]RVL44220.1 hypothetical protein CN145_30935 [Sinorhizobium meliloti]RVL63105.1 hypothetical protein CN138_32290 [Sinorhizobium meliloti]RVP50590.1 hypothetical protein CN076_33395 [Sinorhizobium meliloti]RVP82802.1 hypothetical protein CN073_33020 [Sinorhizobium meliloti]